MEPSLPSAPPSWLVILTLLSIRLYENKRITVVVGAR